MIDDEIRTAIRAPHTTCHPVGRNCTTNLLSTAGRAPFVDERVTRTRIEDPRRGGHDTSEHPRWGRVRSDNWASALDENTNHLIV